MTDHGLDLALIGNGRTAALVDPQSRIVWWCFPGFDGDPIFCRLLAGGEEKGYSDVVLEDAVDFQSEYLRNTAVVSTLLTDQRGGVVRITDFAPRFRQYGRVFRPPQLFRIIEPVAGLPRITVRVRPTHNYGRSFRQHSVGSNHIRYINADTVIRLTSDAPLSLIEQEAPFVLTRPIHLVIGPDEPFTGEITTTCREFADRTRDYWMDWVRSLSISYDWQEAIIRAAITLKLSTFEETGGVIAAHTTSIPEAPGSGRTWDYRYCWLRDAYFVVKALNRIGATQTMEDFITFTLGLAANPDQALRPVYSVVPSNSLDERIAPDLQGYRGDGPVRIGNAAANQVQHDTYGSIILAAMPMFFDRRLPRPGDEGLFQLLERSAPAPLSWRCSRIPVFGNIAAGNASIRIRSRCVGRAVTGSPPSHRGWDSMPAPSIGTPSPIPFMPNCSRRPGTRNAAPSPLRSAPTISTPVCCFCPISGLSRLTIRALAAPSPPWSANSCARST